MFYHNKNSFRKELNRLQYLFRDYLKNPLVASGIRDTYIDIDYTNEFLIVLFTNAEVVKETNNILKNYLSVDINPGCYYIETTSKYVLLLTKDMDGITSGIEMMENFLKQTLDDYFNQKCFDDYIKIRPFKMLGCS